MPDFAKEKKYKALLSGFGNLTLLRRYAEDACHEKDMGEKGWVREREWLEWKAFMLGKRLMP